MKNKPRGNRRDASFVKPATSDSMKQESDTPSLAPSVSALFAAFAQTASVEQKNPDTSSHPKRETSTHSVQKKRHVRKQPSPITTSSSVLGNGSSEPSPVAVALAKLQLAKKSPDVEGTMNHERNENEVPVATKIPVISSKPTVLTEPTKVTESNAIVKETNTPRTDVTASLAQLLQMSRQSDDSSSPAILPLNQEKPIEKPLLSPHQLLHPGAILNWQQTNPLMPPSTTSPATNISLTNSSASFPPFGLPIQQGPSMFPTAPYFVPPPDWLQQQQQIQQIQQIQLQMQQQQLIQQQQLQQRMQQMQPQQQPLQHLLQPWLFNIPNVQQQQWNAVEVKPAPAVSSNYIPNTSNSIASNSLQSVSIKPTSVSNAPSKPHTANVMNTPNIAPSAPSKSLPTPVQPPLKARPPRPLQQQQRNNHSPDPEYMRHLSQDLSNWQKKISLPSHVLVNRQDLIARVSTLARQVLLKQNLVSNPSIVCVGSAATGLAVSDHMDLDLCLLVDDEILIKLGEREIAEEKESEYEPEPEIKLENQMENVSNAVVDEYEEKRRLKLKEQREAAKALFLSALKRGQRQLLILLGQALEEDTAHYTSVSVRPLARVPIVKWQDLESGLSCDLGLNNRLAIRNSHLLATYARMDARLRLAVCAIKHWARVRGISNAYEGTLSSYAYTILVIWTAIQRKWVPCLQQWNRPDAALVEQLEGLDQALMDHLKPLLDQEDSLPSQWIRERDLFLEQQANERHEIAMKRKQILSSYFTDGFDTFFNENILDLNWQQKNQSDSVADLLWHFFHYFAHEFPFNDGVIALRTGGLSSKVERGWIVPEKRMKPNGENVDVGDGEGEGDNVGDNLEKNVESNAEAEPENVATAGSQQTPVETVADSSNVTVVKEETNKSLPKKVPYAAFMANKQNYFFAIEDPFETSHNLGRLVNRRSLFDIRGEMMRAAKMMLRCSTWSQICEPYSGPAPEYHKKKSSQSSITSKKDDE